MPERKLPWLQEEDTVVYSASVISRSRLQARSTRLHWLCTLCTQRGLGKLPDTLTVHTTLLVTPPSNVASFSVQLSSRSSHLQGQLCYKLGLHINLYSFCGSTLQKITSAGSRRLSLSLALRPSTLPLPMACQAMMVTMQASPMLVQAKGTALTRGRTRVARQNAWSVIGSMFWNARVQAGLKSMLSFG